MTKILAVTSSDSLRIELDAAAAALGEGTSLDCCADMPTAIAMMRHEAPDVLLLELSGDIETIRGWQHSIEAHEVTCPIVGVLDDDSDGAHSILVEAVRIGVRDFIRRPASAGELVGVLTRVQRPMIHAAQRGRLLAVASTKGGVGKSTIAVNTAVHWANTTKKRVLMVDASLQLGVAASLLNVTPEMTIVDAAAARDRLDGTLLGEIATRHESGLYLLAAPTTPADAAEVDDQCMSVILGVAKSAFDLIIVDSFPLLDATTLAIFDRADHVCVVTENVVPTLTGTAAMLNTLNQLSVDRRQRTLVLNRFQKYSGSLSADDVSEQLGEPIAAVIRQDRQVVEAANVGQPVIAKRRMWGTPKQLRELADLLLDAVSKSVDRAVEPAAIGDHQADATVEQGVVDEQHSHDAEPAIDRSKIAMEDHSDV